MKSLSELGIGLKFNINNQKNRKVKVLIIITLLQKNLDQIYV